MINFKDRIVQQAIHMVLKQIFESEFLSTSYGFRTFKSCQSAFVQIRKNWVGISWFLKFNIQKCFDKIDKHRLISIISKKIDDQRFLDCALKK